MFYGRLWNSKLILKAPGRSQPLPLRQQTNKVKRELITVSSLYIFLLPSCVCRVHSLRLTVCLITFPPSSSRACAAGAYRRRCWWMRSSCAWSWRRPNEARNRATPAWPTSPPRLEGGREARDIRTKTNWILKCRGQNEAKWSILSLASSNI